MQGNECCANCFGDPGLSKNVIPMILSRRGEQRPKTCDYCGTADTQTFPPSHLREWFELVLDLYVRDPGGKPLASLLAEDWKIFDHPKMDPAHVKELLGDILDDGQIVRQSFTSDSTPVNETPQRWEDLSLNSPMK